MNIAWKELAAFAVAGIALLAVLQIVFVSWRNGISPMPATAAVRRQAAQLLRDESRVRREGLLVEAGSGWGTLALAIAQRCPGWRIIGLENSLVPYLTSRLAARLSLPGSSRSRRRASRSPADHAADATARIAFMRSDLYAYDYTQTDAVVCYLYPRAMEQLGPRLREQLKPGAVVVSICFAIPGWQPEQVVACSDLYRTPIYRYRMD